MGKTLSRRRCCAIAGIALTVVFVAAVIAPRLAHTAAPEPGAGAVKAPPAGDPELRIYRARMASLRLGEPQSCKALTVFPLLGGTAKKGYLTLDEALQDKVLSVTDTGQVSDVKLLNSGTRPVLIVDGEEIVGAKQNRVFNSSLMVGPKKTVVAKVSCVEQGRWSGETMAFESKGTQLFARARQKNTAAVAQSMARAGAPVSDQAGIWRDVAATNDAVSVASPSRAMHRAYEERKEDIDEYVRLLRPVKGQVGAVFAVGGKIVGLDLFDSAETLAELYPKLIKSYALDAITVPAISRGDDFGLYRPYPVIPDDEARSFFAAASQAGGKAYPSLGEGRDLRLDGYKITGAALIYEARPVHAAVFAREDTGPQPRPVGGMAPPNERR